MSEEYSPPLGSQVALTLRVASYVPPPLSSPVTLDAKSQPDSLSDPVNLAAPPYTPPDGDKVSLEFAGSESGPGGIQQYLFPTGIYATLFGEAYTWRFHTYVSLQGLEPPAVPGPEIFLYARYVRPSGLFRGGYGRPTVINRNQTVRPNGIPAGAFGWTTLVNWDKNIYPPGFNAFASDRPYVWNLLQRRYLNGFNASLYGVPFMRGGVKHVRPGGRSYMALGRPTVVNTTADQAVSPSGIASLAMGQLRVSPRMLYPFGIGVWAIGTPWVQRNPSPLGFVASGYGTAWVSQGTRYLDARGFTDAAYGFPRIYDPTIKVYPSSVLRSAVFGDVVIFNKSRFIRVEGSDYFEPSDWAAVESNRRALLAGGWLSTQFGASSIKNGTPSFAPAGFDTSAFGAAFVADRKRYLWVPGIRLVSYGRPAVTRTPSIEPKGFAGESGVPTVWYRVRSLSVPGISAQLFGVGTAWFSSRRIPAEGFDALRSGTAGRVEHGRRHLALLGSDHARYGQPRITNANRIIQPAGIFEDFAHSHTVGGDRWLLARGFDAAAFGTRIIPESQSLYPLGFTGVYGWPIVYNQTQILHPSGMTTGHEPADRWGRAKLFNLRQHVSMHFDPDSHLNPPAWPQWTKIENRNRILRTTGTVMERFGQPHIDNNARPILPAGLPAPSQPDYYQAGMVSYRIRRLPVQGMEAPYISAWAVVYNDAFVVSPRGMMTALFGEAALENTRRYYRWVGAFDASEFGLAMIAPRIRTLTFEGRYTIGSPPIPLHEVKLYTRYIDPLGTQMTGIGLASLSIHRKVITTRWTHQELFGWADLKNLTPELLTRGRASDEFGDTALRLQWRPVHPDGTNMQLFGRASIADRDRAIPIPGFMAGAFGDKLRVIRMGAPPYSEQNISLLDDYGIHPPGGTQLNVQVPPPGLNQFVLYARSFESARYGQAAVRINGATIYAGIRQDEYGIPFVGLKNRVVTVVEPAGTAFDPSPARISPHTIWAVKEAPDQAKRNHPPRSLHYVGEVLGVGGYPPGERFGRQRVSTWRGLVRPNSLGVESSYGRPSMTLRTRYINVPGLQAYRFGWVNISDGRQFVAQFAAQNMQLFGRPSLTRGAYTGPILVTGRGWGSFAAGSTRVEFFHRELPTTGFDSMRMGTRRSGDTPYMWQGLRIGPLMPTIPAGQDMSRYGELWVTHRVRQVAVEGFDAFRSEYDLEQFKLRMRVSNAWEPPGPDAREVMPLGMDISDVGVPNVLPGVHFIRPDGNADQYRKGAF